MGRRVVHRLLPCPYTVLLHWVFDLVRVRIRVRAMVQQSFHLEFQLRVTRGGGGGAGVTPIALSLLLQSENAYTHIPSANSQ